jgi:response regulator RpfG family c-di-GMP phosphodiesterase
MEKLINDDDIAIILLDIVMETDDAGLKVVKKIRNDLKNSKVRIILRTGQPGLAPQKEVILNYDINDYKEKTELTSIKLFSSVVTAIRSYKDLNTIEQMNFEIIDTQKELISRLGSVVESRSKEVANHVNRVAKISYLLAINYGLSKEESEKMEMASPMHDIGKVAIPDNILLKPSRLTKDEFEVIKTHSNIGYNILKCGQREILKTASIIAHEHHEKWDGTGYPQGLEENKIHIYGRITAIADVFDALTYKRVYKEAWTLDKALDLIQNERGKHFDPKLVDIFFDNIQEIKQICGLSS